MDILLAGLHAQLERPQTRKFAWPVVILPELFTTSKHLSLMAGYLVSLGWEVYLVDVHSRDRFSSPPGVRYPSSLLQTVAKIGEALDALGTDVIALGHGLGGLLALKIAETPVVRAAVAFAPLVPGFRSPLVGRDRRRWAFWRSEPGSIPTGRTLYKLVSDADPFQRQSLMNSLVEADASAAIEVARGDVEFATDPTPKLIIAGGADEFAPSATVGDFAAQIGALFTTLPGRSHWLIGGKALEQGIAEAQRFLVRAMGEELLLLYSQPGYGKES
jgi:pimeloyl-ACP methyl ester carboxylesterase